MVKQLPTKGEILQKAQQKTKDVFFYVGTSSSFCVSDDGIQAVLKGCSGLVGLDMSRHLKII